MLDKFQYKPITINAAVSECIRKQFLINLDPNRLFFTQQDINYLNGFLLDLTEPSCENTCKFLTTTANLYRIKLLYADSLITNIISKPLKLNEKDSMPYIDANSKSFATDSIELAIRWQKWLKYQVLNFIFQPTDECINPLITKYSLLLDKEEKSRAYAGKKEKQKIKNTLGCTQGFENFVAACLLKTIAGSYDAHTDFFSAYEKQQFENSISTSSFIYGFSCIENNEGHIIIEHIIPGSSAWKSNQINKGDQLIFVKFPGATSIDLSYAGFEETMRVLSSPSEEAEFTIKKPNGQFNTVSLKKEKIRVDDDLIKSYILKGKQSIGYISLPDFYTDLNSRTVKGCANDMAKEILKLQKENISGLIIDLRYNGGGSMEEAIDLAGIFINEGPLIVINNRQNQSYPLKDLNRGTIYNGPLLLLVNGFSASAAELLAGTLQDYNRAVIAGCPTFGKATIQAIYPLDISFNPEKYDEYKTSENAHFLKITTGKFYRVTGKSHQQIGVIPDINLPSFIFETAYNESSLPNSLPQDSISKKIYFQPLPAQPLKSLATKSNERISVNKYMGFIKYYNDSIGSINRNNFCIPLEIESFRNLLTRQKTFLSNIDSLTKKPSSDFTVINNQYDKDIMKINTDYQEINSSYLERIQKDIYIEECFYIMNDMINYNLNKQNEKN